MPFVVPADSDFPKPKKVAPAVGPRPDKGPMDETELKSIVDGLISAAATYIDGEVGPARAKKTDYYMGRPFGNEEPGRSQFISTDVRDGIHAVLPAMLKVVFGAERAVEFEPIDSTDVDDAEQATEYVQMVFAEDNPGFRNTHAWLKDGLMDMGIVKWWWDDTSRVDAHKVENVDQTQLELLAADDEIEITRIEETGKSPVIPPSPDNPQGVPPQPLYTVEFTRTVTDGRARWEVIPPEEFLFNRESRDLESGISFWHRTRKTKGELLAMGVSEKDIKDHGGDDPSVTQNEEAIARNPDTIGGKDDEEAGEANQRHMWCEGFARIDFDGDGKQEMRKIGALGPGHHPVLNEPAAEEDFNFAVFVADPEPHTLKGLGWADRLMDLQLYKSMLMRGLSDSLATALFPRIVYKSGDANLADILNNQLSGPIRVKSDVNSVKEFAHSFLGKEAMPVIDLIDSINERRTGQNRGVATLDADALQSSTPAAVQAAVSASQAQQELLVRIFAETGLKPLFKGLLRLLVTHQPRARMVKLRNKWVEVDPREWNIDMDAHVNVALGSGLVEEKVQTLMQISDKQFEVIEKLGPQNPIVGLKEARDTLAEITELRGRKNSAKYWKPVTQEQLDALAQQAAQQPPQPSPEVMVAQAQVEVTKMKTQADIEQQQLKAQRELQAKQAELSMRWRETQMEDARDRQRMQLEDDRERTRMATEAQLEMRKLELDHAAKLNQHQLDADIERERNTLQAEPNETE